MKNLLFYGIFALCLMVGPIYAQAATHSVALTWSWSQGSGDPALGFHVQRSLTTGGPYTVITTTSVTVLTYTDLTVVAGTTYYYVVTAYNAAGDSLPSNQVTAVIPVAVPAAPSLTAVVK
jgi:fibronectin type 3 domain-containing protein